MSKQGHNQTVSDDAVVVVQLSKMLKANQANSSANGEMRAVYENAEKKGVNLAAAKSAIQIIKSSSDAKIQEYIENTTATIHYLGLCGFNLTKAQRELFDFNSEDLQPIEDKAFSEGLYAGRTGLPATDCKHDQSTTAGQKWIEGHNQGASERQRVFDMDTSESSDEPATEVIPGEQTDIEEGDDDANEAIAAGGEE